ncbi:hypothetical protein HRV97_09105 [Sphingomonas sp. HHU CXW]|uniref:Uncharacterized protein n=1 Tax=Sphingomonas hominis TaxID=2741495 RepID=A0ABX2JHN8_9SPHN|nr:hypothetical protein [Sphingomonas hominis]NTS65319.1 hypothetical protein [Sphingomonas hominis]
MSAALEPRARVAADRRAARAVAAVVARLAARLRDVPGVAVEESDRRVVVSGAGLHARRLDEARLRDVEGWLR